MLVSNIDIAYAWKLMIPIINAAAAQSNMEIFTMYSYSIGGFLTSIKPFHIISKLKTFVGNYVNRPTLYL